MTKKFYYNRTKLRHWLFISFLMFVAMLCCSADTLLLEIWFDVVKVLTLIFFIGMLYVCIRPQTLAQIDNEGIIIDSNAKLKWSDISKAEVIRSQNYGGRHFIRFKLKKGAHYKLRWMQKMSAKTRYGAFSIPLYAMTSKDALQIEKEIMKHMSVSSKIKNAVQRVFKKAKQPASKTKAKKK